VSSKFAIMVLHGIKIVVNRTGLTAHVLRVWEKRYQAVTPQRTETNRRLYSDADIKRLQNLIILTRSGHSIGQIASLSDEQITDLIKTADKVTHMAPPAPDQPVPGYIEESLKAVRKFDQSRLEQVFDHAIRDLGYSGLINQVLLPFIRRVGTEWHEGNITSADEHAATNFIKDYLTQRTSAYATMSNAPTLMVTTPAGQLHELGAFIASCLARKLGWQVVYLGSSLPADAIAGAVVRSQSSALLLSIVYPMDDPSLSDELRLLRKQLPKETKILVGGDGTFAYEEALQEIGATIVISIADLENHLNALRKKPQLKKISSPLL